MIKNFLTKLILVVLFIISFDVGVFYGRVLYSNTLDSENTISSFEYLDNEIENKINVTLIPREDKNAPEIMVNKDSNGPNFDVYLLVGLDTVGDPKKVKGRADTIIVAFINNKDKKIDLLQIPRDTLITIDGERQTKINHSYVYGGINLLTSVLNNNFGISVDKFYVVNFTSVKEFVNLIGGVKVNIDKKYCYRGIGVEKETCIEPGEQTLNGTEFLTFWRVRNYGTTHISDLQRLDRQSKIFLDNNLLEQVRSKISLKFINDIKKFYDNNIYTNDNITNSLFVLYKIKDYKINIYRLEGISKTGSYIFDSKKPVSVFIYNQESYKNWIEQNNIPAKF